MFFDGAYLTDETLTLPDGAGNGTAVVVRLGGEATSLPAFASERCQRPALLAFRTGGNRLELQLRNQRTGANKVLTATIVDERVVPEGLWPDSITDWRRDDKRFPINHPERSGLGWWSGD